MLQKAFLYLQTRFVIEFQYLPLQWRSRTLSHHLILEAQQFQHCIQQHRLSIYWHTNKPEKKFDTILKVNIYSISTIHSFYFFFLYVLLVSRIGELSLSIRAEHIDFQCSWGRLKKGILINGFWKHLEKHFKNAENDLKVEKVAATRVS